MKAHEAPDPDALLNGLGRALRWLRERQGKRQYLVANAAGITKGMLSAYETDRQKPTLETLQKILSSLDCNFNDLHNALQIINERPGALSRPGGPEGRGWDAYPVGRLPASDLAEGPGGGVYRLLGIERVLEPEEEQALEQILHGVHRLVRHLHETLRRPASIPAPG